HFNNFVIHNNSCVIDLWLYYKVINMTSVCHIIKNICEIWMTIVTDCCSGKTPMFPWSILQ
ncbi:MAG: hypothetical protein II312_06540, partial [Lachnospiraceae bacterium]|nr:hypothetical protein [Lachnospiraceae bacterium]